MTDRKLIKLTKDRYNKEGDNRVQYGEVSAGNTGRESELSQRQPHCGWKLSCSCNREQVTATATHWRCTGMH